MATIVPRHTENNISYEGSNHVHSPFFQNLDNNWVKNSFTPPLINLLNMKNKEEIITNIKL